MRNGTLAVPVGVLDLVIDFSVISEVFPCQVVLQEIEHLYEAIVKKVAVLLMGKGIRTIANITDSHNTLLIHFPIGLMDSLIDLLRVGISHGHYPFDKLHQPGTGRYFTLHVRKL